MSHKFNKLVINVKNALGLTQRLQQKIKISLFQFNKNGQVDYFFAI